ncbi:hypothetical protein F2Q69_00014962 [Brassica cretica]|uniref:Uncharacterized protein n=2 Tax=Brassica cretica TaxID=69181 RepID=A0A3N6Q7H1_BRACR|nr:hypothetical protein F2Q69_00014962 [Brassica cretica]KAF3609050.1 hypothetical protein DY000_02047698 [Brassica cretica]
MIVPSMRDSLLQGGLSANKNASRLYFYYSLSYEMTGDLVEIRGTQSVLALFCNTAS